MKHLKRILSIILVLAVFAGSFVGSWHLFNQGTYEFDSENLAVFDENLSCYYLQKDDKDIIFRVRCEDGSALGYSLVDDRKPQKVATIFSRRQMVMRRVENIRFLCRMEYRLNPKI